MFRESMEQQEFVIPHVANQSPAQWPGQAHLGANFWGFVAHAYKGYHYYTGSDFPADKPSRAAAAFTDDALLVHVAMQDPVMQDAVRNIETKQPSFFMADHVTVNIVTPGLDRYLFAVNPRGTRHSERNLDRDTEPEFTAAVTVRPDGWDALFTIPFRGMGIEDPRKTVLAFDIVRQEQGDSAISTLTRAALTPPYNYIYEYPIFHFSPLFMGAKRDLPMPLFADALRGARGVLRATSTQVTAGGFCELEADLVLGKAGLRPGGRIRLRHAAAVLNCGTVWTTPLDWQRVQIDNPRGAGYLSIEGATFAITTNGIYTEAAYTGTTELPPETAIRIRVGDRRHGGPGIRAGKVACANHPLVINVDPLARGLFEPIAPWPEVQVVAGAPAEVIVTNPGAAPAGAPFEICLRVVDHLGNLCEAFEGTVGLSLDAERHSFPSEVTFGGGDHGAKIVTGAIHSHGVFCAVAQADSLCGRGNFIATDGQMGEGYLLFGDIHCHTSASDGWRTPEEKVRENRFLRGLQFMAIADHDFDMSPAKWEHHKHVAAAGNEPGGFITYLAHEWTPSAGHGKPFHRQRPGHYVIVYPEYDGALIRANDQRSNTPEKLFAEAKQGNDLMVIPHYHGGRPPISSELSPAIEIAAWDGKVAETEADARDSVFTSLNAGAHVGLIAGTDHGGEGLTAFRNGEMFGVWVDTFDRDAIRTAIRQRRTIAVMHTRVLLDYTMNGHAMGSVVDVAAGEPRTFEVWVAAAPYPLRVELLRNGQPCASCGHAMDEQEIIRASMQDDEPLEKEVWYLLRVTLHGGERCWSSPLWVRPGA